MSEEFSLMKRLALERRRHNIMSFRYLSIGLLAMLHCINASCQSWKCSLNPD
jgi:hypothetical protein